MGSFYKHTARDKRKERSPPSAVRNILCCQISKGAPYTMDNDIYDYYNVTVVARSYVREQVIIIAIIIEFSFGYFVGYHDYFLQIRRMMSCVVFCGYDRLSVETVKWLLNNPDSQNFYGLRIPVAPPQGLFLTEVVYPTEMFTNPFPYYRHAWDYPLQKDLLFDEDTTTS
ncbi:unnamed protein product [Cylicostephanus goldi]|uniref:tRNA pseudouridine synthase n=1 Tax=Cylicostephanus goldi TaxID=71465 RepID=A0A3P6RB28_CYLGO|nr:unnamed protein product [Cylicostephanus goldi]